MPKCGKSPLLGDMSKPKSEQPTGNIVIQDKRRVPECARKRAEAGQNRKT